jgi:hypothetical protein
MKKLITIIVLLLFLSATTAHAGYYAPVVAPVVTSSSAGSCFGALTGFEWGVLGAIVIATAYGAYKTHKGDWGKDGPEAVKNCIGTHTNGNCAHLPLVNNRIGPNFGPPDTDLEDIIGVN